MVVDRERFVARRTAQILSGLDGVRWCDPADAERFSSFVELAAATIHMDYHDREQALVEAWHEAEEAHSAPPTAEVAELLAGANYTPVTIAELDEAMKVESLLPLRLDVDLDDYDDLVIERRGSRTETVELRRWRGLRTERRQVTVDENVVVLTRIKPRVWFDTHGEDPVEHGVVPGRLSLKLFQHVPRADIEMLLPSTKVKFRPVDTVLVGVPALISGIVVLTTKLLPTLGLIALLAGAWLGLRDDQPELDQTALVVLFGGSVTLGAFFFRQWAKLKNQRVEYLKTLSENLYFRTRADGTGVLHLLLASAEEQDLIEVLLAYRMLLDAPDGTTVAELDQRIETWLHESGQTDLEAGIDLDIDFDIDDAVAKLARFELIEGTDAIRAVPLDRALAVLDRRWDDRFRHRNLNGR